MGYKAHVSLTENSIKETRSVLFIENLLVGRAKTDIEREDKKANIDGFIELINDERRIIGKITVQVKTVRPCDEGKNKFPCPTSLFAYAENTTDVVYLLAVDHSTNTILFKHISKSLLSKHRDKEKQETITLNFNQDEKLRQDNVDAVLKQWLDTCNSMKFLLFQSDHLLKENEELKNKLLSMKDSKTTLKPSEIQLLQNFSDEYNRALDITFAYIKKVLFPNVWKRGIAIYEFTDNSLEYSLFNIKNGELLATIVQMPPKSIFELDPGHDFASFNKSNNPIKQDYVSVVNSIIEKHVADFIKHKRVIPFDETFLVEYIFDFVDDNHRKLHISTTNEIQVGNLLAYFERSYPNISHQSIRLITSGRTSIYLNTIYEALRYLNSHGFTLLTRPYPTKGKFGNTGWITDWYSEETAYLKVERVISATFRAYQNFIQSEFPLLASELDLFWGGNLIYVILDYSVENHSASICAYYFKNVVHSNEKIIMIESIDNSDLLKENNVSQSDGPFSLLQKETVHFRGFSYSLIKMESISDHIVLFDKYNCLTLFYDIMKRRFDNYFKTHRLK